MRHGTVNGYSAGCGCFECIEAGRAYYRKRNGTMNPRGTVVTVDVQRLERAIRATGLNLVEFSEATGMERATVARIVKVGRCYEFTLDNLACALGCHMSEFEASA